MNNTKPMRWFYVSYNGVEVLPKVEEQYLVFKQKTPRTVMGHLAFWHEGFPSMLFLCHDLIPAKCLIKVENIVLTLIYEFSNEEDYADFVAGGDMDGAINNLLQ